MKVVACHQPNFLPWLGFFSKMAHADVFILLDDVQPPHGKSRHNFVNRVQIADRNGPLWITLPLVKDRWSRVRDMVLDDKVFSTWTTRVSRTIEQTYARSQYASTYVPEVIKLLDPPTSSLVDFNYRLIVWIRDLLEIRTTLVFSSEFEVSSTSSARLAELTELVDGSIYLSGKGSIEYLESAPFESREISVKFHSYEPHTYEQQNTRDFHAGLSVVDSLFNIGPERTRELVVFGD